MTTLPPLAPAPDLASDPLFEIFEPPLIPRTKGSVAFLLLGVILPLVAIATELALGARAIAYIDFYPHIWYAIPSLLVPLLNFFAEWALRQESERWRERGVAAVIGACAIATPYAVALLPTLPFAVIGIFFVIGLLPMAPLLSIVAGLVRLRKLQVPFPDLLPLGKLVAILVVGLLLPWLPHVHTLSTYTYLRQAIDAPHSGDAVTWLRDYGDTSLIEKLSTNSEEKTIARWIFGPVDQQETAKVHWLVTGEEAQPQRRGWSFDRNRGGAAVGAEQPHLSVDSSRMEVQLHPQWGYGYTEWTLNFANSGAVVQEARALVQLPRGSVVTKATLWIDGEERAAAFGEHPKRVKRTSESWPYAGTRCW